MKQFLIFNVCLSIFTSCAAQQGVNNIRIINLGSFDNSKLTSCILALDKLNPKVIALDVAIGDYNGTPEDKHLFRALTQTLTLTKKLVVPLLVEIKGKDYYGKEMVQVTLSCGKEFFRSPAKAGFVSAKKEGSEPRIPNRFMVSQEAYTGDVYYHFSIVSAMSFDSVKTLKFIKDHEELVDVNYGDTTRVFPIYSAEDVTGGKLNAKDIAGKIIMMGYLGPEDRDKFLPALNDNRHGSAIYGVEYLANIVAQVLESK